MFKLLDIYYFKNAREIDLNMAAILVTWSGCRLYVFDKKKNLLTKKIYKTIKGAKAEFYRLHVKGRNNNEALHVEWFSVVNEVKKLWPKKRLKLG